MRRALAGSRGPGHKFGIIQTSWHRNRRILRVGKARLMLEGPPGSSVSLCKSVFGPVNLHACRPTGWGQQINI
ncbi:MAG: hypothetical protein Q4G22_00800 [Paracoccus sp. (in: a-proteobacteria)]|uniref:hypothetical protein n=1 Tax=Paracoccus sp. TaxID=267 RepID=UPI0026DFA9EA|nr:hypothetical protein [Paracoccus sp. (in: a-proteobacteria)]MDO5630355.1 hypothetical protein [Paracoccus sp. (in: a-proteobacteria)]